MVFGTKTLPIKIWVFFFSSSDIWYLVEHSENSPYLNVEKIQSIYCIIPFCDVLVCLILFTSFASVFYTYKMIHRIFSQISTIKCSNLSNHHFAYKVLRTFLVAWMILSNSKVLHMHVVLHLSILFRDYSTFFRFNKLVFQFCWKIT